jgi:hypothetical protein
VTIPAFAAEALPRGDLEARVDAGVTWFLDVVSRHRRSWLAATAAGGVQEPEVAAVLAEADEITADTLLQLVGLDAVEHRREELRAMFRAYGGMGKAAAREWLEHGVLDRAQVHRLLTTSLLAVVRSAVPAALLGPDPGRDQPAAASTGSGDDQDSVG